MMKKKKKSWNWNDYYYFCVDDYHVFDFRKHCDVHFLEHVGVALANENCYLTRRRKNWNVFLDVGIDLDVHFVHCVGHDFHVLSYYLSYYVYEIDFVPVHVVGYCHVPSVFLDDDWNWN